LEKSSPVTARVPQSNDGNILAATARGVRRADRGYAEGRKISGRRSCAARNIISVSWNSSFIASPRVAD
jgi:hypothetical protein